jgi:hypothetical protein
MNNYIRLYTDWDPNPKIRKLYMYYRTDGIWGLFTLWTYAAEHHSDGTLTGLSDFDIMIAAGLPSDGRFDSFARRLCEIGLLDYDGETYSIHDWAEHNPHLIDNPRLQKHRKLLACVERVCMGIESRESLEAEEERARRAEEE